MTHAFDGAFPDQLSLVGMVFYAYHGVYPEERKLGQRFTVDVHMHGDFRRAGEEDDLDYAVNYAAVYDVVRAAVEGEPVRLIEALAERIARRVLAAFPLVGAVEVAVEKPGAPVPGPMETVRAVVRRTR
ncbi:dihydroneopterin aldolase [Alicyclobacillus acidocaldarius]|uniref:7,8-dihydroneopterin aldolase n=1 Tax=Alicyclobacillus acidocaldarius (strain Tc-4-1) TaxID=1048834 RepID=F8IFV7_ALIAT|nr:dihydroneopterin aldolase [Alicyclobacillus acidocaldarius]AEJ42928.1 dihydroneopterin aldolase [Alicyclobacillus acidocaldarius subsp. acidocaldarius Tc-4-1]